MATPRKNVFVIPKGQKWLIDRMIEVIPTANVKGICFGIAHMGMQAILSGETEVFNQRLQAIHDIKNDELNKTLDALKAKRVKLIDEVKEEIKALPPSVIKQEKTDLKEEESIKKKLKILKETVDKLVEEKLLSLEDKQIEYTTREQSLLLNAYKQKKINERINTSSPEELSPEEKI